MKEWTDIMMGIVMGAVTYFVVDILLDSFGLSADGDGGEGLIATLVPIAIAVAVAMYSFNAIKGF